MACCAHCNNTACYTSCQQHGLLRMLQQHTLPTTWPGTHVACYAHARRRQRGLQHTTHGAQCSRHHSMLKMSM
eukprot:scaffold54894_cov17-Tisochrysis_lutea.AAC.1